MVQSTSLPVIYAQRVSLRPVSLPDMVKHIVTFQTMSAPFIDVHSIPRIMSFAISKKSTFLIPEVYSVTSVVKPAARVLASVITNASTCLRPYHRQLLLYRLPPINNVPAAPQVSTTSCALFTQGTHYASHTSITSFHRQLATNHPKKYYLYCSLTTD